jgi:excisionase family DNA binding protein
MSTTSPLLTLKDTAAILRVSYGTVRAMAADGRLPVILVGRQIRVDPEQLKRVFGGNQ